MGKCIQAGYQRESLIFKGLTANTNWFKQLLWSRLWSAVWRREGHMSSFIKSHSTFKPPYSGLAASYKQNNEQCNLLQSKLVWKLTYI